MKKFRGILGLGLVCGVCLSGSAGIVITAENDYFINSDDNFSHGTEIEYTWWESDAMVPYRCGVGINQSMFTPQDISASGMPPMTDRPWCGTLGIYLETWKRLRYEDVRTRYTIGVMGPDSYAEDSQRIVHKALGCTKPMGWDNQMPDELMLNIYQERFLNLYAQELIWGFGFDIKPLYGFTVGTTYDNIRAGGQLRFGYNIPFNSFVGGIVPKSDMRGNIVDTCEGFFIYAVGEVEEEFVLHNATLGDSWFRDRDNGQERELEEFVYTYKWGMVTGWKNFSLSYMFEDRAEEFDGETDGGMSWGMVRLEFLYQF